MNPLENFSIAQLRNELDRRGERNEYKEKIKCLTDALSYAKLVVDGYALEIRNGAEFTGVDLIEKGFCQGILFKDAVKNIESRENAYKKALRCEECNGTDFEIRTRADTKTFTVTVYCEKCKPRRTLKKYVYYLNTSLDKIKFDWESMDDENKNWLLVSFRQWANIGIMPQLQAQLVPRYMSSTSERLDGKE